jgi:hypothetical protein
MVSDCQSLVSALENFEFLVGLVIWHDILFSINKVSKKLQSKIVSIDATLKHIEGVISYFKKYRDEDFTSSMDTKNHFIRTGSQANISYKKERERNILMKMMKTRKCNSLL